MRRKNMSQINLIAAVGKNRVIGKNNDLVWKGVPGDMKRFKEITTGHPVIMGRKTFESLGSKPLPNRTNFVITKNVNLKTPGCFLFTELDTALDSASKDNAQVFVIGGGEIYSKAIKFADRLYLTLIDAEADGDVFFPDYSEFKKVVSSVEMPATEKFPHKYKFVVWEK